MSAAPLLIQATKKLAAKLTLDELGFIQTKERALRVVSGEASTNPLSGWHANLITLQRRKCVLLVHDATRFPVFIKALKKADYGDFNGLFADAFMNTLLKSDATHQQLDAAARSLAEARFDTQTNRSVMGTLNRIAGDIDHLLYYDNVDLMDVSAYGVGAYMAERPCSINKQKKWLWPKKSMLALLDSMNGVS